MQWQRQLRELQLDELFLVEVDDKMPGLAIGESDSVLITGIVALTPPLPSLWVHEGFQLRLGLLGVPSQAPPRPGGGQAGPGGQRPGMAEAGTGTTLNALQCAWGAYERIKEMEGIIAGIVLRGIPLEAQLVAT